MKKLFTFCLSLIFGGLAFTAQAQTNDPAEWYKFVDKDGQVLEDGATLTCNTFEFLPALMGDGITSHVKVKFAPAERHDSQVAVMCDWKTANGPVGFQCCFGGNCVSFSGPEKKETSKTLGYVGWESDLFDDFWMTDMSAQGSAEVEFQIMCYSDAGELLAAGDKITVRYTTETTGIDGVEAAGSNEEVARYTLDGRKLSAPQKGVNIVKYADGSTKKVVVE